MCTSSLPTNLPSAAKAIVVRSPTLRTRPARQRRLPHLHGKPIGAAGTRQVGSGGRGLWLVEQVAPLKAAVVDFVHDNRVALGVQMSHAGQGRQRDRCGGGGEPLRGGQLTCRRRPSSRFKAKRSSQAMCGAVPNVLDRASIDRITALYVNATRRAVRTERDVVKRYCPRLSRRQAARDESRGSGARTAPLALPTRPEHR
jgi:hypothetical protein